MAKNLKTSLAETVQEKLDGGHVIRPFPDSVSRLLTAFKDADADVNTFSKIIELDVGLCSRILRMVNSPLFGIPNNINSITHAIGILGIQPLKSVALTYVGSSLLFGEGKARAHRQALWNHSMGVATVARVMANSISGIDSDEAFLAGIFHDIGKLFFLDVAPEEYLQLTPSSDGGRALLRAESDLFGIDHQEAGLKMTLEWPLPDEIRGVIRYHHEPEFDASNSVLSEVIHISNGLARSIGLGSRPNPTISLADRATETFGIDEETLDKIRTDAIETFDMTMLAVNG